MSSLTLGIDGIDYHQKSEMLKKSALLYKQDLYKQEDQLQAQLQAQLEAQLENQLSGLNCKSDNDNYLFNSTDTLIISEIYNPMNLANIICNKFKYHKGALVKTFIQDLQMFDYLYEFLPQDISVCVLNSIPLKKAVDIIRKRQCSTYIYDKINPILYVVRYFADLKTDLMAKDPHCIKFDRTIIPQNAVLDFVLKCKEYITDTEFEKLVKIVTNN